MAGSASKMRKIDYEKRQFNEDWTYQYFMDEIKGKVVCLICSETLSVMKEFNSRRHYESKHAATYDELQGELRKNKIEKLKKNLSSQRNLFFKQSSEMSQFTSASCKVAQFIAKSSRPFSDGDFLKDCMHIVCAEICPQNSDLFKKVPLSRMTMQRRVEDIGEDITEQLRDRLASCKYFSLALDESNDNTDTAQLLVFVRAVSENFELTQELAGLASLHGRTTGLHIFNELKSILHKLDVNWSKLCSITTDGAPAMVGKKVGLTAHLKQHLLEVGLSSNDMSTYHCLIHQESLCGQVLKLDNVMQFVFASVNFIRSKGLNHRQFRSFLQELEADYTDIPYHAEVRWLSKGKVLKRFVELRKEIREFLSVKGRGIEVFDDKKWLADLAFLTDITGHLNALNLRLQGKSHFIFDMYQELHAFRLKLRLLCSNLQAGNLTHLETCSSFKIEYNCDFVGYHEMCEILLKEFNDRFVAFEQQKNIFTFVRDPFSCAIEYVPDEYQLEAIDLQCSDELRSAFKDNDIITFYRSLCAHRYSKIKDMARKVFSQFGSTYLCEQTFSIMNLNKNNLRSKLTDNNLSSILKVATSELQPNFDKIVRNIQSQPSH